MNSRLENYTPVPIHRTNLSLAIANIDTQQSHAKTDRIFDLYSKFLSINSQVSIDYDLSAFNLIQYHHKEIKMDFDQQMIVAKLKRLENNAELKRINMELENRRKKTYRNKVKDEQVLPEREKYLNTYREFTEEKSKQLNEFDNHSQSDEDNPQTEVQRPKGITFFTELRKHPKVLEYTVEQVRSKEKLRRELVNSKQLKREQFKSQIRRIGNASVSKATQPHLTENDESNPERIADNIFRKLYTKRNKERSIDEIKQDRRLNHFVTKQEMIVERIDGRSLSKEMHKKLKERLNDIATELYLDEKKHQTKTALPKVRMNKTFNTILK